jgi:hypothetical protein
MKKVIVGVLLMCCVLATVEVTARQRFVTQRQALIAGLGIVTMIVENDGGSIVQWRNALNTYRRLWRPTAEVALTIGSGADALTVEKGPSGVSVARRGQLFWLEPTEQSQDAIRAAVGGQAVDAFRGQIGQFARSFARQRPNSETDPHAFGLLVSAALVGELAGDNTAMQRARDLIMARTAPGTRPARFRRGECTDALFTELYRNDNTRTSCLADAENYEYWYQRAGQRLLCEAEFMSNTAESETKYAKCLALM